MRDGVGDSSCQRTIAGRKEKEPTRDHNKETCCTPTLGAKFDSNARYMVSGKSYCTLDYNNQEEYSKEP